MLVTRHGSCSGPRYEGFRVFRVCSCRGPHPGVDHLDQLHLAVGPVGPNKGRSSDPRIYQFITDFNSTLGSRVWVLGLHFHDTTPLIPP